MIQQIETAEALIYPDTDGQPMGENTLQVKWIVAIYNGLEALFRDRADAFVAADLFWYPVLGKPKCVLAPDVMVAFGRPKGDRRSYKQWEEEQIPPQVVIEILSPGNRVRERAKKFGFYERHGVEEYYEYDPDEMTLEAWGRRREKLAYIKKIDGFTSPRLGVRFEVPGTEPMRLIGPDGKPFRSYLDLLDDALILQERAAEEGRRARAERRKSEKLEALLREHGIDPNTA